MFKSTCSVFSTLFLVAAVSQLGGIAGCANVPLGEKLQGAVVGAIGSPSDGAIASRSYGVGSLISPELGAGSFYLIGAQQSKIDGKKVEEARAAAALSRNAPATLDDVRRSESADLNGDGFVTQDEIVAMKKAGLSDREMIDRLQSTADVFLLTDHQQDSLRDRNVSQSVIDAMLRMNHGYSIERPSALVSSSTTQAAGNTQAPPASQPEGDVAK